MAFPVGLALSNEARSLYVVNSDFDLRFNGGTVMVLDTDAIQRWLPRACNTDAECEDGTSCAEDGGALGLCVDSSGSPCGGRARATAAESFNYPGPCSTLPLDTPGILRASAVINPFVADVRFVPGNEERGARIVMPVRGDATLHWADVHDDVLDAGPVLDCGQTQAEPSCDSDHRLGDEAHERTLNGDKLPTEPFGIAVSRDGETIFVGHQSQGSGMCSTSVLARVRPPRRSVPNPPTSSGGSPCKSDRVPPTRLSAGRIAGVARSQSQQWPIRRSPSISESRGKISLTIKQRSPAGGVMLTLP
jgi:hypothetical protein